MKHVPEHEWELLKEQTAAHLTNSEWLGGGHSILPVSAAEAPVEPKSDATAATE